jgi:hypothetical protein
VEDVPAADEHGSYSRRPVIFRRRRFADAVSRQLDLFARDSADLLTACEQAEETYNRAPRDEAEEAFGDYQDAVEWAAEELVKLRDTYAATLEEDTEADYVAAFDRAAARRFPRLGDVVRRS